ncbi:hypothetical protein [Streptomyces sp. NBC_01429]|uniref:hypothetical protein n=1 Tax=Streptomyces sp. NBC_01429 TaxID=2903862 RepID=UPI002E28BA77|nr:hypothetical protein [Streptomyces sp. NBC_01429]
MNADVLVVVAYDGAAEGRVGGAYGTRSPPTAVEASRTSTAAASAGAGFTAVTCDRR